MLTWSTKMWDCEACVVCVHPNLRKTAPPPFDRMYIVQFTLGYNEFDFFLENKEYRPFDGCKIEI
jgi:hypothetical protein